MRSCSAPPPTSTFMGVSHRSEVSAAAVAAMAAVVVFLLLRRRCASSGMVAVRVAFAGEVAVAVVIA